MQRGYLLTRVEIHEIITKNFSFLFTRRIINYQSKRRERHLEWKEKAKCKLQEIATK